jgi:hypothetical protein
VRNADGLPDVKDAETYWIGIRALRKHLGGLSHDAFAQLLAERTGHPVKRQTVIPWEKPQGTKGAWAPSERYRPALFDLGLPRRLLPEDPASTWLRMVEDLAGRVGRIEKHLGLK